MSSYKTGRKKKTKVKKYVVKQNSIMINHTCHNNINNGSSTHNNIYSPGGLCRWLVVVQFRYWRWCTRLSIFLYIGQGYKTRPGLHYLGRTLSKEVSYSACDRAIVGGSAGSSLLSGCLVLQAHCLVLP